MASGSISSGSSGAAYSGGGGGGGGIRGGSSGSAYSGGGGGGYGGGGYGGGGGRGNYMDPFERYMQERYMQELQQAAASRYTGEPVVGAGNLGTQTYRPPPGLEVGSPTIITDKLSAAEAYRQNPTSDNMSSFKDYIKQQNVDRFGWSPGVKGLPPVATPTAAREGASADRYRNFLLDSFINPNSIGSATIDRATGRMIVPTSKQEYAARNATERAQTKINKINKAAMNLRKEKRYAEALDLEGKAQEAQDNLGGGSFADRYQSFLNQMMGMA